MHGYEIGLAQGHHDEGSGMEKLACLAARRQLVLKQCRQHVVTDRAETLTMAEGRRSRNLTRSSGKYARGSLSWKENDE